jgi:hypothetical protein
VPLPDVQARLGHNDLTSTTHYVWALSEESETAANAMNVVLGYQQEQTDPQQEMLAKMAAMMDRMEAIIDPVVVQKIASEQITPRTDLLLVTDTLTAMHIQSNF